MTSHNEIYNITEGSAHRCAQSCLINCCSWIVTIKPTLVPVYPLAEFISIYLPSPTTCLSWTYFGPSRFIHRWMTIIHVKLCVSDVTDKWNSWLVDVMFNWHHIKEPAVECNNQTCWFIIFLRHLFYKIYLKTSQIMNKNDVKINGKYIYFFWHSSKYECNGSHAKLTWCPKGPMQS